MNLTLMSNPEGSREQHRVLDIMLLELLLDTLIIGSSIVNCCRIIRKQRHHSIIDLETSFLQGSTQDGVTIPVVEEANHNSA